MLMKNSDFFKSEEKKLKGRIKRQFLECPYCSEFRETARGLYWHLVCDHKSDKEAAYSLVSGSLRLLKEAKSDLDFLYSQKDKEW